MTDIVDPVPLPPAPPVPQRADPATFEDRSDDGFKFIFEDLPPALEALNVGTRTNAIAATERAVAADERATDAEEARDEAQNAAAAAASTAGAQEWVSGQAYAEGDAVWSPINKQTYRRNSAGAGVVDPAIDSDNWTALGTSLATIQATALLF